MAEQPSLGRTFGLRGSPMRVLRITGTEGYAGDPHLRGIAFDTYKDGLWGPRSAVVTISHRIRKRTCVFPPGRTSRRSG
jgi:hypothetical protein